MLCYVFTRLEEDISNKAVLEGGANSLCDLILPTFFAHFLKNGASKIKKVDFDSQA